MAARLALSVVSGLMAQSRYKVLDYVRNGLAVSSITNAVSSVFFKRGFSVSSSLLGRTHVDWKAKEGVAVVELNEPHSPGNSWTVNMQDELMEVMDEIWTDDRVHSAAVVSPKADVFLIGVDVNKVKDCKTEEEATLLSQDWQKMMDKIENSPKPIVAAINGWCVNGGLEFAMACQYRVATRNTATIFGTREMRMGLMPSAGGTVRLTKLVGPYTALDFMLEGYTVRADAAKKMGLVHKVIDPLDPDYLKQVAVDCARGIVNKKISLIPQRNNLLVKAHNFYYSFPTVRQAMYKKMWERVAEKETFTNAPIKIIDTVKTAVEHGAAAGYQTESQNFGKLALQYETKVLIKMHQDLITFYTRRVIEDLGY